MMLCLKVKILNVDSFDAKQKNCILISVECKLKKWNDWNESEKGKWSSFIHYFSKSCIHFECASEGQ